MTNIPPLTPIDDGPVTDGPSFLARSKKALAGGVTAGVAAGTTALTAALADGAFAASDGWAIAAAIIGGFLVGFTGVWVAPPNATS